FSTVVLMGSGPRMKFGTAEQEISAAGEKKWEVSAAVTFHPNSAAMRPVSEVISVVVTGPANDPAGRIKPGRQIELDGFKVGISSPELRDTGRIAGGRPWFQATGVRQVTPRPAGKGE